MPKTKQRQDSWAAGTCNMPGGQIGWVVRRWGSNDDYADKHREKRFPGYSFQERNAAADKYAALLNKEDAAASRKSNKSFASLVSVDGYSAPHAAFVRLRTDDAKPSPDKKKIVTTEFQRMRPKSHIIDAVYSRNEIKKGINYQIWVVQYYAPEKAGTLAFNS